MVNLVILVGFIASLQELRVSGNGNSYLIFTIAVNYYNRSTNGKAVDFIRCIANGKTAEFISMYFNVGSPISIVGALRQNNYVDKCGNKQYSYQVFVEKADFCGRKCDATPVGGNPSTSVAAGTTTPQSHVAAAQYRNGIQNQDHRYHSTPATGTSPMASALSAKLPFPSSPPAV